MTKPIHPVEVVEIKLRNSGIGGYPRLDERLADAAAGKTVWFRRPPFRDFDNAPKAHVFARREHVPDPEATSWDFRYVALCDYRYQRCELAFGPLSLTVTMPPVADRCLRCERARKALLKST